MERIHSALSRFLPNLFAYHFLVVATRMDGISDIFEMTVHKDTFQQLQEGRAELVQQKLLENPTPAGSDE